ncbi:ABC transporter permease subunit [Tumebacillus permanentifrigoris]|uniref:Glutathione transport system permease protein GsiD n=1 Tax=Tumebacillus permanentifrigoris TaxID=378543 RepID=A0A316DDV9_9BACL|nr:ABC transporter permease subunit [Tumebacillus permanentifrigoris]PWK16417.1 glutathione transport system permease protein [Tumebacillus permanentifrigoris]
MSQTQVPVGTASVSKKASVDSPWRRFIRRFRRQRLGMVALGVVALLLLLMAIGPAISPFDPTEPDYDAVMEVPSAKHWFGTDDFGRDIFSRVLNGTRISLAVGLCSVFGGALIGMFFGLTAGYYGGKYDGLVMRACDVLFAFPGILLAIAIIAILGPGLPNVVIAVAVFSVPIFIRIVRGETLALKNKTYIEAARATGLRDREIIWRHLFPGTISVVLVYLTMRIGSAILIAASLSFLGMGAQPPTPEWGAMLSSGRDYLTTAPHVAMFPGLAILVTCLGFNLLGDALRDALDRKLTD